MKYEYGKREKLNSEYKRNLVKLTFTPSMTAITYCPLRENTGWSQRSAISGFHVTSEKIKIKSFKFLSSSGKSHF